MINLLSLCARSGITSESKSDFITCYKFETPRTKSRLTVRKTIPRVAKSLKKQQEAMSDCYRKNGGSDGSKRRERKKSQKRQNCSPNHQSQISVPLSAVVSEAVVRWFEEARINAEQGDVKSMALLGTMYMEGYGCQANKQLGEQWIWKAKQSGCQEVPCYCIVINESLFITFIHHGNYYVNKCLVIAVPNTTAITVEFAKLVINFCNLNF
eukprot:TRINITY_DN9270_c0_g1_i2.p1 TRINITY_DN9270_c0_g1~~TRINITY_DN9270_c0_g1_i2.p1  ORF type:complete len:211 (-),score=14.71 TRINITY_DN9270_c0_g1_i2:92-724(-)